MTETRRVTFAAGSGHLNRSAHLRDIAEDLLRHRRAALLPLHQGRVLIDVEADDVGLGWVPPRAEHIDWTGEAPIFLGLSNETPCFAADFAALDDDEADAHFCEGARFMDLRAVASRLGPASASIAATAKAMTAWHLSHAFCARCGSPTDPEAGGWRRTCSNCGAQHFPRTDPVVIMLILSDDAVLVGRQRQFPDGIYSLLAGFMEPGETVEDAVRREVLEEAGVEVGAVGYLGSQPWPYVSNIMLGCVGIAETTEIRVDPDELEDAQWISRAKMDVILQGKHPRINPPRDDAIARAILSDWVNGEVKVP
ncbi:MAG: NAD(+) diphosphatase [Pseudomonadota bacterium]